MPATQLSVLNQLTYANLQMAAEATRLDEVVAGTRSLASALEFGNNRLSKFTPTQAADFVRDWDVVSHQKNTSTGFSGTLFSCRITDPARGLVYGQLVLSFRSTEFIDDAARDNLATNTLEIKEFGWAFGQIADMRNWVNSLYASGRITADRNLTVTGYSLGGHLATAFNMLFPGDADATYTFNGAGVGSTRNNVSLSSTITQFEQMRQASADLSSLFSASPVIVQATYQSLRSALQGGLAPTTAQLASVAALLPLSLVDPGAKLLVDAVNRLQTILTEAARVPGLPSGSSDSPPPVNVTGAFVEATGLNYQLAVLAAARNTAAVSMLSGGLQALTTRQPGPFQYANFYDVYGQTQPSAVANSQLHYGAETPVFIEDQPLYRGSIFWDTIAQTALYQDVKLLVPGYAVNDFGDTHSLVLLVDSLSLQAAFAQLDPNATQDTLNAVLRAASNKKSESSSGTQGNAEGDALENALDGLRRLLGGADVSRTQGNLSGGTWAETRDVGGYAGRNTFHERLQALIGSSAFQSIAGKVKLVPANTIGASQARSDFASLASLLTFAPFTLQATEAANRSLVDTVLQGVWGTTFEQWQADRDLRVGQRGIGQENFTDQYLTDRAAMLDALALRNQQNLQDEVAAGTGRKPVQYQDVRSGIQFQIGLNNPLDDKTLIRFGGDAPDTLDGKSKSDHLYGGAGTDTLNGLGGNDWLEGNAGDDTLTGGAGNDTLLGGTGSDTYNFTGAFGHDTVIDADGLGTITVEGYGTLLGAAAGRLTSGSWKGDDPRVSYTLVSSAGRQDLLIRFTDQPERSITIRGWSGNAPAQTPVPSLGMSLANVDAPAPATVYTLVGTAGDDNVPSSLPSANLSGLAGNDALRMPYAIPPLDYYGWTLDQTHGVLDGGAGDDLFLGGDGADIMRGGDGNDSLYGGIRPFDSWSSGLTWSNFWGMSATDTRPFIDQYYPQLRRDADANVIDAGAGLDSVAGGWGDDVIDGGADADVLFGLAGDDIIQGGTGDDALRGDGATRYLVSAAFYDAQGTYHTEVISPTYAPVWLHGRDVLDGGDGDDILAGDGNDDELYGGDGNDTLNGDARGLDDVADDLLELPLAARGNDWLDGGAGNDKLIGDAGNDTLYGGTGSDTYTFNDEFSRDGIIDADGSGRIQRNGADLPQGLKVFDGLWQSADRKVTYTQITNEAGDPNDPNGPRHDLVISFADSTKRIVVRGWNPDSRSLGISFGANFAKPVTTQNYIGNFTKKIIGMGAAQRYEMLGDNYVADVDAGPQPGAADQIVGLAGNEAFYGLGGDDATLGRAGDDYIDGGDVLQGAMHAARWKVCSRGRALGAAPTRSVA